jgi:hypothetical protein
MTTNPTYPVRPSAPGPCVILDLPRLWEAVLAEMDRRDLTELKQVSDLTGVDRNTLGRIRKRALAGEVVEGQRGGINVNAYLTLVSFAHNGRSAAFGHELRGGVPSYAVDLFRGDEPADVGPTDTNLPAALSNSAAGNVADLGDFTQYADTQE